MNGDYLEILLTIVYQRIWESSPNLFINFKKRYSFKLYQSLVHNYTDAFFSVKIVSTTILEDRTCQLQLSVSHVWVNSAIKIYNWKILLEKESQKKNSWEMRLKNYVQTLEHREKGITEIPSNDFSHYDNFLTCCSFQRSSCICFKT